ncbi:MAG: DUF2779 domain-containing protein [Prevotella sp.]|jgi:hypothetical protein|nr:DUF2779 domain-containing protein [Prevotella sp.]
MMERNLNEIKTSLEVNDVSPIINKTEIKNFLETINYPLYYLDFETFMTKEHLYDNMKPYQQTPFQYSLHIQDDPSKDPAHKEFLAETGKDPRRELAENLCKDIPNNVCVLAYNMSFEKTRLKELSELFPDLSEHLMKIHDNCKDLMLPFQKKDYYDSDFGNSYSLKTVLPVLFPNDRQLDYNALKNIHNGIDAMEAGKIIYNPNVFNKYSNSEIAEMRQDLLDYCNLDTLAMVRILDKLHVVSEHIPSSLQEQNGFQKFETQVEVSKPEIVKNENCISQWWQSLEANSNIGNETLVWQENYEIQPAEYQEAKEIYNKAYNFVIEHAETPREKEVANTVKTLHDENKIDLDDTSKTLFFPVYGYYDLMNGHICLDINAILDFGTAEAIDTLVHEGYHAAQNFEGHHNDMVEEELRAWNIGLDMSNKYRDEIGETIVRTESYTESEMLEKGYGYTIGAGHFTELQGLV